MICVISALLASLSCGLGWSRLLVEEVRDGTNGSEAGHGEDPHEKLAHRRMTVLELAERLGNVSEACRRGGIDRTSFYDWKRRFQLQGLDRLKDRRRWRRAIR